MGEASAHAKVGFGWHLIEPWDRTAKGSKAATASARMLAMLPGAAEEFRRQLALGLEGSERDVLRARVALRRHFGGEIRVESEPDGGVVAHWREPLGAVFKAVVTCGSGGRIHEYPPEEGTASGGLSGARYIIGSR
jgi:hypothetical protein